MAFLTRRDSVYYVNHKNSTGSYTRLSCHTTSKAAAKVLLRKYEELEFSQRNGFPIKPIVKTSVIDCLLTFKDKVIANERKTINSINREQTTIENFINYLKEQNVSKFEQVNTQEYIDHRVSQGFKPNTILKDRLIIRKFYLWAIASHYTATNPTASLSIPKITLKPPRFFSVQELSDIYAHSNEPYRSIYRFLANTGLRSGELANLTWNDYNREQQSLTIKVIDGDRAERRCGNKTKRECSIPLNATAISILENLPKTSQYMFVNESGFALDNDNCYRNLQRTLARLNIKDACVHTFRHTFASHLVISGVSLYVVRDLLRHKSIQETEIYAHLSREALTAAVSSLSL